MNNGKTGSSASSSNATTRNDDDLIKFLDDVLLEAVDAGYQLQPNFTAAQVQRITGHAKERLVVYLTARDHKIHEHAYQLGKTSLKEATQS